MRALLIAAVVLLSGCTSALIMSSYQGKSLLDVVGDYGMPAASFDTPEGYRSFIWQLNHSGVVAGSSYTSGSVSNGNFFARTTVMPPVSYSVDCNYVILAKKVRDDIEGPGAWEVVGYKSPRFGC